ncbi:MAG: hypothetical protein HKN29_13735 [Rhodothermales bacterium]|nr:hypothetical protein [Rhodothermales bacterium]
MRLSYDRAALFLVLSFTAFPLPQDASGRQFVLASHDFLPAAVSSEEAPLRLLSLGVAIPIRIGSASTTQGVRFRQMSTDPTDNWPSGVSSSGPYREIRYEVSVTLPMGSDWTSTVYVSPGIASDLNAPIQNADWDFRGALFFEKQERWGLGVTYRSGFDLQLVPLLKLYRSLGSSLDLELFLPSRAAVWKTTARNRRYGLLFQLTSGAYHLGTETISEADHTVMTIGPGFRGPLAGGKLGWQFSAGFAFVNDIEFGTGDGEVTVSQGTGLSLGLALLAL